MFGHKRIPGREGGVEVVVEEMATRMTERGHEVTCINRRGHHVSGKEFDSKSNDIYKGVRIETAATIDKKGLAAMTSSFFAALKAARGDYEVVHIHAEGPAAMCWIPKLSGKKVVVTVHGLDWARAKWGGFATKYIRWGEKQAVKHADEIIVLSNDMREYFKREYDRRTTLIPNGVNRPEHKDADEISKSWGLTRDSYVLFVGRIVPEKGLKYLIEAWKDIKTDKKLVIVGGSSDTSDYYHELKRMSPESVIFTGFQQGEPLVELYSNAYLYVLPSDLEGMPLSLLEAMSYGKCCLVSDIHECTEVVEDNAVRFEKSNIKELGKKLQELLDSPQKVKDYENGSADFILKKYNWDDIVDKTLSLYGQ